VNKFDLLFDEKQFEVAFGAVIGESRSVLETCRPDTTKSSEGESASVGAGVLRDGGQKAVCSAPEDQMRIEVRACCR